MDFLKIDLDTYEQFAYARLRDEITILTQALFNTTGATITRFGAIDKPKQFHFSPEEADAFCDAWMDYRGRALAHKAEQETRKESAIADAQRLASNVTFDLDGLNIQIRRDDSDNSWAVEIPAIGYCHWLFESEIHTLSEQVQNARKHLRAKVEHAEQNQWSGWTEIVASYRRVFPLEPAEITEARKLLTEAGLANWSITRGSALENTWNFDGPFGDGGEISMPDESPAQLLADIKEYLERKKTDAILNQMDQMDHFDASEVH